MHFFLHILRLAGSLHACMHACRLQRASGPARPSLPPHLYHPATDNNSGRCSELSQQRLCWSLLDQPGQSGLREGSRLKQHIHGPSGRASQEGVPRRPCIKQHWLWPTVACVCCRSTPTHLVSCLRCSEICFIVDIL